MYRQDFLGALATGTIGLLGFGELGATPHRCHGRIALGPHPEPRPGIDAANVLPSEELDGDVALIELYDGIRAIPEIADGIRCPCGCAEADGFRSLLICFEDNGMAMYCEICQTVGRMTVRYHGQARTLGQIRAAIDARYG